MRQIRLRPRAAEQRLFLILRDDGVAQVADDLPQCLRFAAALLVQSLHRLLIRPHGVREGAIGAVRGERPLHLRRDRGGARGNEHLLLRLSVEGQEHRANVRIGRGNADLARRLGGVREHLHGIGRKLVRNQRDGRRIGGPDRLGDDGLVPVRWRLGERDQLDLRGLNLRAEQAPEIARFRGPALHCHDHHAPRCGAAGADRPRALGRELGLVQRRPVAVRAGGSRQHEEERGEREEGPAHHQRLRVEMETIRCRRETSVPTEICQ